MEVVKYVTLPPLYMVNNVFTVNLKKWNSLPADLKTALNNWAKTETQTVGQAVVDYKKKSLEAAKKYGVQFVDLPLAEMAKMREAAEASSWTEWAKQDKHFAEGMKIVKDYYSKKQ